VKPSFGLVVSVLLALVSTLFRGHSLNRCSMLVEFATSKWYVLIVNSLRPVFIMVFQGYGTREGLQDVEIDTNVSVRGVPSLFGRF
jgi:hypothetical protein